MQENGVARDESVRYFTVLYIFVSLDGTGFSSDGEFNYLRSRGYTRPLSVLQVRSNLRIKYSKMSQCSEMLTPKGN